MRAQLIPINGDRPIEIEKDVTVVGRQHDHCDIVLKQKSISKIHCVLIKTDGLLLVRDLVSTNGTKVNGQRVSRGALLPGDQLAFASEKFRVNLGPDAPVAVSPHLRTEVIPSLPPVVAAIPQGESQDERQPHLTPHLPMPGRLSSDSVAHASVDDLVE